MEPASVHADLLGSETRYYQSKDYRTRAIEVTNGNVPLILMHGGGGHAEAYSRNVVPLSAVCQPIAIDLLWHGLSSKPAYWNGGPRDGKHWLNQFTDQVLQLLDVKGIDKAVIEGESLGGWVAVDFALRHPDRVAGVILNTAWGMRLDPKRAKESAGDYDSLRASSLAVLENPSYDTVRKRMEWLMPLGGVTEEIIDIRRRIWSRPDTKASLSEYYVRLFDKSTDLELFNEQHLSGIKAKTLVLWTDHNPIQGVDAAEVIAESIAGAELYVIKGAGHWPQWEKPEEYNRVVSKFIQSL